MATASSGRPATERTYERSGGNGGIGGFVAIFPGGLALCAIAMFLAPLRWHTSPWLAVPLGLVLLAVAVGLHRLARRLKRARVVVGAGGVRIVYAGHERHLDWADIAGFRPGTVTGTSPLRGEIPVVVAELRGGRAVKVDPLRVDHGRLAADRDRAEVERLCAELESLRPSPSSA